MDGLVNLRQDLFDKATVIYDQVKRIENSNALVAYSGNDQVIIIEKNGSCENLATVSEYMPLSVNLDGGLDILAFVDTYSNEKCVNLIDVQASKKIFELRGSANYDRNNMFMFKDCEEYLVENSGKNQIALLNSGELINAYDLQLFDTVFGHLLVYLTDNNTIVVSVDGKKYEIPIFGRDILIDFVGRLFIQSDIGHIAMYVYSKKWQKFIQLNDNEERIKFEIIYYRVNPYGHIYINNDNGRDKSGIYVQEEWENSSNEAIFRVAYIDYAYSNNENAYNYAVGKIYRHCNYLKEMRLIERLL